LKKISFKDSAFGWDGLTTFIFSNLLIVFSLGTFLVWLLIRVLWLAITAATRPEHDYEQGFNRHWTILVAGFSLENNQPTEAFKMRLDRARALVEYFLQQSIAFRYVMILGGITGDNTISEAEAGAEYLIQQGMNDEQIVREQHSRHTLENMQHARKLLQSSGLDSAQNPMAVITSRFHLYRLVTLASGLGMQLLPVAAEPHFKLSIAELLRVIKEAYYLHWYWSGKLWVFITANRAGKARIS
jgi:uncharacterized SAM-binding protein YcdF (DUF218 family)